jgi:lipopolysaccharide export system permease protein
MTRMSFLSDLKPGTFFTGIPGTLMIVGGLDRESGNIDGLMMVRKDGGEAGGEMIIARKGAVEPSRESDDEIVLRLERGRIHPITAAKPGYTSGSFLSLTSTIESRTGRDGPSSRQMLMATSTEQLREVLSSGNGNTTSPTTVTHVLELNRRLAVPVAVLLYPLLIFPPAVSTGRHGKAAAFSGSLVLFLAMFFLNSIGFNLAHEGLVKPALGAWLADLTLLLAGLLVFTSYAVSQGIALRHSTEPA